MAPVKVSNAAEGVASVFNPMVGESTLDKIVPTIGAWGGTAATLAVDPSVNLLPAPGLVQIILVLVTGIYVGFHARGSIRA